MEYKFNYPKYIQNLSQRKQGISGLMRIKNEEEFVEKSIRSYAPFFDEIVAVYNRCNDNTPEILYNLQKEINNLKVIEYKPFVHALTSKKFVELPIDHEESLVNYYNFTLFHSTYNVAVKIDADQVAIPNAYKVVTDSIRSNGGVPYFLTFKGINLYEKDNQLYVNKDKPFHGLHDHGFFNVNERSLWYRDPKGYYEQFTHNSQPDFPQKQIISYPLHYHCRYLKKDKGIGNWDLDVNKKNTPNPRYYEIAEKIMNDSMLLVPFDQYMKDNGLDTLDYPEGLITKY